MSWIKVSHQAWAGIAEALTATGQPWRDEWVEADLDYLTQREEHHGERFPSRRALLKRWSRGERFTRKMMHDVIPKRSQSDPTMIPTRSQRDPNRSRQEQGESGSVIPLRSQSDPSVIPKRSQSDPALSSKEEEEERRRKKQQPDRTLETDRGFDQQDPIQRQAEAVRQRHAVRWGFYDDAVDLRSRWQGLVNAAPSGLNIAHRLNELDAWLDQSPPSGRQESFTDKLGWWLTNKRSQELALASQGASGLGSGSPRVPTPVWSEADEKAAIEALERQEQELRAKKQAERKARAESMKDPNHPANILARSLRAKP